MIEFRKIRSEGKVIDYLHQLIAEKLAADQKVLWLVAGGSAMGIAVEAARKLKGAEGIENLAITLTDERFGEPGHADSNWRQLHELGFDLPGARMLPVLTGKDLAQTAADYRAMLTQELTLADFSLALAGMGADGHIFGIKPGSAAVGESEDVVAYEWDDYTRITPALRLIRNIDEVVLYATGSEKHPQLDLLEKEVPAIDQPAQQLKELKNVIFFNDYKGEEK